MKHLRIGMLVMALFMAVPMSSMAQTPPTPPTPTAPNDVCTTFTARQEIFNSDTMRNEDGSTKMGLLSNIYIYIKSVVDGSTQNLYESLINNNAYRAAVGGAMTLMIIIFGVGFTIGVIQPSFGQALVRLLKFAIIAAMIAPSGWAFFSSSEEGGAGVAQFFNEGTDELIVGVMKIGTGAEDIPADATPFFQLDKLAEFIIQPDSIIAIMGSAFSSGPYGLAVSGLMVIALAKFLVLILEALKTYAVSYVARALLLGVAPIFIVFLLFDRTKQLFMSWVNALLSLSLQPILLFTFLSFFMVLIESATKDMLNTELCWTEFKHVEGTTNKTAFWRWVDGESTAPTTSEYTWKGAFECTISGKTDCPEFPINIIDMLTFLLLVTLASRFASVIPSMANELSNTFISLDTGGRIAHIIEQQSNKAEASSANVPRTTTSGRSAPPKG